MNSFVVIKTFQLKWIGVNRFCLTVKLLTALILFLPNLSFANSTIYTEEFMFNSYSLERVCEDYSLRDLSRVKGVNTFVEISENSGVLSASVSIKNEVGQLIEKMISITGKVIDENGEPLPGAVILEKGASNGVVTDLDGNFEFTCMSDAILIVSFIGYETQEVKVNNRLVINIQMRLDKNVLDEVVVVGYGTQKRTDLTGAVTSVNLKEEEKAQYTSIDAMIQGRAAGVRVTTNNSGPGASLSMNIRGVNSLRGDNQPLYVVDGIIMDSAAENESNAIAVGNYNAQESQNGLTGIDPQDIKDIEILKDASATAIYGSRGANGVVLITTKEGSGRLKVAFRSTTSLDMVANQLDVLDGETYARYQNELDELSGQIPSYDIDASNNVRTHIPESVLENHPDSLGTLQQSRNWSDRIFRPTLTNNYRISLSGSSNKTRYYFALGYLNQQGVVEGSGLKRVDMRMNLQQEISSKLKVNARISVPITTNNMILGTELSGVNNLIRNITASPPLRTSTQEFIETGVDEFEDLLGPETFISGYDDKTEEYRVLANIRVTYKISNIFSYQLNFGGDLRIKNRERWQGLETGAGRLYNGMAGQSGLIRMRYNVDNLLLFKKRFNKNHKIDGTIGTVFDEYNSRNQSVQASDYSLPSLRFNGIGFGNVFYPIRLVKSEATLISGLTRLNYAFKNTLFLTASFRADGSSKFSKENQFSYFPSFGLSWQAGNERFLRNSKVISKLKFRASWGRTGNQGIAPYETFTLYNTATYPGANDDLNVGAQVASIANTDLKWETTEQSNAGVDFSFFNNRINGTVDVFSKKTTDLLQNVPIPTSAGFERVLVNLGGISNRGLELGLNSLVLDKAVSVKVGGNISFVRNQIDELGLTPSPFGNQNLSAFLGSNLTNGQISDPSNIFAEGHPVGMFWGYKTNGVYFDETEAESGPTYLGVANQPGDIQYIDQNGDNIINDLDKTFIGDPNPKFSYGFTTDISYKDITLSLFFNGVYGNQVVNANRWDLINSFAASPKNILKETYERAWRPDTPNSDYPRLGIRSNTILTDRYVEDASFLRLSLVSLGWKVPIPSGKAVKGLRVSVTGKNLLLFTNYSGYDPEVNSFAFDGTRIGIDLASYPNAKSFALGVNLTF